MGYAKSGDIHEFCQPNALLTFKENLMDYADESLKKKGEEIILKAINEIDDDNMRTLTTEKLKEIENGKRDLYF